VNQYAAMPSLHFGWNLLVGIAIFRHGSGYVAKAIGVALPVVMFASIVLTANHYILDGLAGGTLALMGLSAALWLNHVFQRRTGPPRSYALAGGGSLPERSLRERVSGELSRLIPQWRSPAR
jgi:hypothetical protein